MQDKIIDFVKNEPRTVQDVAKLIEKSWVTADSYIRKISESTGLISIKTFRKGTQGALKIVYYNQQNGLFNENFLIEKIKNGRNKQDIDFMEIFQQIEGEKKVSTSNNYLDLLNKTKKQILFFSGNLSFLDDLVVERIKNLIEDGVKVKILCRVNLSTLSNIQKWKELINLVEIKHSYHPLRGFIIDTEYAHFKQIEEKKKFKEGELEQDTEIYFQFKDIIWVEKLEKLFWYFYRNSENYEERIKVLKNIV